jgi:hypothetical protein
MAAGEKQRDVHGYTREDRRFDGFDGFDSGGRAGDLDGDRPERRTCNSPVAGIDGADGATGMPSSVAISSALRRFFSARFASFFC